MMETGEIHITQRLTAYPAKGTLDVVHFGRTLLASARAEASYRNAEREKTFALSGDVAYGLVRDKVGLSARDETLELAWQASVSAEGIEIDLQVTNVGSQPVEILQLRPIVVSSEVGGRLDLGASPETWSFYRNGWQSWSPTFARHVDDGLFSIPDDEEYLIKHHPSRLPSVPKTLVSHGFTVLCDRDSRTSLLLGFITAKDQLAEVRLQAGAEGFQHLAAICHADGVSLSPGESLTSERLLLATGDDPLALLELYGRSLGQAVAAPQTEGAPTGWCSWYHFYGENTEDDVLANLAAVERQGLPLEVMLIDDGYQREIGDWLETDEAKFPRGMKWLAQKIKEAGYRPGLWIVPFAVSSLSRLYAEHPGWVLRSAEGEPILAWHHWAVPVYALDVSHPEVQGWLRELFGRLSQDCGYELFKLDFLYAAALKGQRCDPQMTRAQALRLGLEIIREAVGEKFLLGCGCPLGPAVGLVDAMRIGPDVATYWRYFRKDLSAAAAENALRNAVTRHFMHRRLWLNDPDCALVRSWEEESDLTLNEMRTLVTIVGLCGGVVMSGDDLASMHPSRLKYLKSILPPYGESAIPLDLFDNELPRLLSLTVEASHGQWLIAAFINWEDHTVRTVIEFAQLGLQANQDYHVYDYWHRRYLGTVRERLVLLRHQPHETVVLLFKPVSQGPELLTSTFHLTQGAAEVRSLTWEETGDGEQKMVVQLDKQGSAFGQLLFTVPEPYVVVGARLNGRRRGVNHIGSAVVSMGFRLQDRASVEIYFAAKGVSGPEESSGRRASEKLMAVLQLLLEEYGHHQWRSHRDPLSELVRTILSQNTSDVNSDRAFARLRQRFPSWQQVRDGDMEAIVQAIEQGGLARTKAPRIKGALQAITAERGELDLEFLREMELDKAKAWLESLVGVGPKTAACVLLFSLGRPVLPVDTHVHRVSRRLGLIEPHASAERAHEILGEMLPDGAIYDFHVNMVSHGRQVCQARRPRCDVCTLAPRCDYLHRGRRWGEETLE